MPKPASSPMPKPEQEEMAVLVAADLGLDESLPPAELVPLAREERSAC